ncbi:MAG: hypothetical protein GY778_08240 [bacterium]|nr:hypothetical protein [bacterium]
MRLGLEGAKQPLDLGPFVRGQDLDLDRDGDLEDFGIFQHCCSGPGVPADPDRGS